MKCVSSLLFLCLSVGLFSQSFSPEKVYQVTGAQLNRLELDLTTAKSELTISLQKNEQLTKDSEDKLSQLDALKTQLTTASESLKRYENRTAVDLIMVGIGCLIVGFTVGLTL